MTISLRPYQTSGIERVLELFSRGVRRVLLVLPTGGGKTVLASEIIRLVLALYSGRVLFLAHRRELVRQAFCKLVRNGLHPGTIGVVMSGIPYGAHSLERIEDLDDDQLWQRWARRRPPATVQVGSIDTFRNKVKPDLGRGLVVVDEAHRALAKSYVDVQAAYPETFHLGLTATPFRADGKGLRDAYDEIVVVSSYAELVGEGFLVAPRCFGTPKKVDLTNVRRTANDYNSEDLARAVDQAELVGDIVEHWQRLGNNLPTICFAAGVAHSKHIVERFVAAGIAAVHVDGETDTAERDRAFRGLRDGSIRVLCNCDVATEGTDVPCVKTIILARPTLSERIYLQQVGRGSRPFHGCPFVVLDHAGCVSEFGFPHSPREYSLDGRKKKAKAGAAPVKECPRCFALVPIQCRECEGCGYEFPLEASEKKLEEKPGELVELTEADVGRLAVWNKIVSDWEWQNIERRAHGEKLLAGGTCRHTWSNATGRSWPPKGSRIPKLTAEEVEYNNSLEASRVADRAYAREKAKRQRATDRVMGVRS